MSIKPLLNTIIHGHLFNYAAITLKDTRKIEMESGTYNTANWQRINVLSEMSQMKPGPILIFLIKTQTAE